MRMLVCILGCCLCDAALADTVVPTRTIRAQEVIEIDDLKLRNVEVAGAATEIKSIVGLEARVALYAGRPVRMGDVGPPAVVDRNQLIMLVYDRSGLVIRTEGRALNRAGVGDLVKVMNLASRATLIGRVQANGEISVSD